MCFRAFAQGFGLLLADQVSETCLRHRPERGGAVQRIADDILFRQVNETVHKTIINGFVNVDAFNAAAALAGVEEGPIHKIADGMIQIGIGQNIGRILPAKLEPQCHEGACRSPLDSAAAANRTGEIHVINRAG